MAEDKARRVTEEEQEEVEAHHKKSNQANEEAKSDDDFKNCTTELSMEDYSCAIAAKTIDALSKCLE